MQRDTLKDRALELLCDVVETSADGKSVGRPYGEICEILRAEFPEHKWNMRIALHWYANKTRSGKFPGYELPDTRPPTSWSAMDSHSTSRGF